MKTLSNLLQQMQSMRIGMLRIREKEQHISVLVEATNASEQQTDWNLLEECEGQWLNKQVSLVQRQGEEMIYATGIVSRQRTRSKTIISLQIIKACWIRRKVNKNVSWLEEIFVYEREPMLLKVAS